jgi:hypothetical protein
MDRFLQLFGDSPRDYVVNSALMAFIAYWAWRLLLKPLLTIIGNLLALRAKRDIGLLEITPPKQSAGQPLNTQSLFSVLQQHIGRRSPVSFEIVGSKKAGIQYRVIAAEHDLPSIQKQFAAYMPELKFKRIDTVPALCPGAKVFDIKQARHFAYPLKPHEDLTQTDPIAFIAGSMTRLKGDEEVAVQLVVRQHYSRKVSRVYNQILHKGHARIDGFVRTYLLGYWRIWAIAIVAGLITLSWEWPVFVLMVFGAVMLFTQREERELTHLEEVLYENIAAKLSQPLFSTDMRFSVYSEDRAMVLANDFESSLGTLNAPGFQTLSYARHMLDKPHQKYITMLFNRRLGSVLPFTPAVLSASELAALFHFPQGIIRTEGMVHTHSRILPAPVSLHGNPNLDVVIGVNKYHGSETLIGLTEAERERHMFVIGGTGSGKTTLLKYQIIQDIQNGKGLAVIDPHGDLAEELLEYIPEERKKDLIYLNPDDLDHPIGVNLLELPEDLTGNDLLREKDRVTESVVSVMRKIFSDDDSGGHRIEYVLRNAVQTALTLENPTLFTIFRLLNDGKFAKDAIKNLEDEDLKLFWKNELGKAGTMQKVKMAAGITAKIGRFLFSASARAMLEKEKSDINFDEILNGKIIICNFSKGRLGEDTSMLFGVTILAKLQLAALKRSEKKQSDRKPFYLYVDEFQNFATLSFTQMLSEARKYKVFLTMAEQSTQQQDDQKMVNIILANVGTVVVFRTGSPKDEELLLPLFEPYIEKGEISNLSAYNFYCRITSVDAQEPMSGETIVF